MSVAPTSIDDIRAQLTLVFVHLLSEALMGEKTFSPVEPESGCRDVFYLVEFALATLKIAINQWNLAFLMPLISGIWCR
jgi:hypothetical protein